MNDALRRNPKAMINWAKLVIALEVVYTTAVSLTKLSILFLLHRVFSTKPYPIIIRCFMVLVVEVRFARKFGLSIVFLCGSLSVLSPPF